MTTSLSINPLTRIEGHLSIHAETEPVESDGQKAFRVKEAKCEGEMFRGIESILKGRDPLDAQQITQRICGVCPVSHGIASVRAQEMAYGIAPSHNGRLMQNLILAANYLQSHILHFYHLAALDFVDVTAILKYDGQDDLLLSLKSWIERAVARNDVFPAAPFLPRYEVEYLKDQDANISLLTHYVQALELRKLCHEMGAIFGARLPHSTALVPGGCTQEATMERVVSYRSRLGKIFSFVKNTYIPDLLQVAVAFPEYFELGRSNGNFLCYGVFPMDERGTKFFRPGAVIDGRWQELDQERIAEYVGHSRFSSSSGLHPASGETDAEPNKSNAYSWIKAPRYNGQVMEVGPLARVVANYLGSGNTFVKKDVDAFLANANIGLESMFSVLGRHVARGLESIWIAKQAYKWLDEINVHEPPARDFEIPERATGYGLTEAPRGALGHWLSIKDHRIERYQCIVPTTWNCSPRDDRGRPGAVEQAIVGTTVKDPAQPIEVGRIVRSFDPCIACAVH